MARTMGSLTGESYDREYSNGELLSRIGRYFVPWWQRLTAVSILVALIALFTAVVPVLVARGVGLLEDPAQNNTLVASVLIGSVLVLGVLVWVVNWRRRVLTSMLIADVIVKMRSNAFRAVMNHDMSFFDEYQSGRIVSRITSDSDEFGRVANLITELFSQFLQVFILVFYLGSINLRLTLLMICVAPLALVIALRLQTLARRITQQSQRAIAEVNVSIQEAVTGISVAKNFRRENGIYEEFLDVNAQSYEIHVERGKVLSLLFPSLQLVAAFGISTVLYYGGNLTYAAVLTAGSWFLFMSTVDRFWFPMINLAAFWPQFQSGLSATERIFALIDAESVVNQVEEQPVESLRGDIEFKGVDFGYGDKDRVLADFDLHIQPGESIALVGHTGAGKSSIAKLVTRFYEFQAGELLIDGRDIRTLDLQQYRRQLGIVSQAPFLFNGSVAENIRYGAHGLSDDEIEEVARQIGGGDWIETLPEGLATDVGERGGRLSMGQRQLVALARVLAHNPAIFILDEATASIDPFTEYQIQTALDLIFSRHTSIVIAHRLSTIKAADRIIVLDHGQIIEAGDHDALLAQSGHYAELYNTYFRHQSLEYINSQEGARQSPGEAVVVSEEERV